VLFPSAKGKTLDCLKMEKEIPLRPSKPSLKREFKLDRFRFLLFLLKDNNENYLKEKGI